MAVRIDDDEMAEECGECGRETPHEISIQLLMESRKEKNAEFSREPYRMTTCRVCGTETLTRMNNA